MSEDVKFEFVDELDCDYAKEKLGYSVVDPEKVEPHCRLKIWDEESQKLVSTPIRFANNNENRPIRLSIANRYANEIIRRKWLLNGETLIFDEKDQAISAQHRLVAVIIAEQMRLSGNPLGKKYKWNGAVTISAFVVTGVAAKAADTVDQGTGRTAADVLFRRREFSKKFSEKENKKLSKILGGAARLAWIKMGGKDVSDAAKFMHSEMLDFVKTNKYLKDCSIFVMEEDANDGAIRSRISLPYMAGLLFLFSHSNGTDKKGQPLDETATLAKKFVANFARGSQDRGCPTRELWEYYGKMLQQGTRDRDTIVKTAVKAWIAFSEGKKLDAKSIKLKKGEEPFCGGYDVKLELDPVVEESDDPEATKPKRRRRRRKKVEIEESVT